MKRSRRLAQIARLAGRRTEEAARVLQQSSARLDMHQRTRKLLDDSHRHHVGGIDRTLREGSTGYHLKLIRQSLQNLEGGLAQMTGKIRLAEQERRRLLGSWSQARAKERALRNVVGRARRSEQTAEERRRDTEIDDQSAQRAQRRKRPDPG